MTSTHNLSFDENAVEQAADAVDLRAVAGEARRLLTELAAWISPVLGLGNLRVCALLWMTLQRWQVEHYQAAESILQFPPSARMEAIRSVIEGLRNLLEPWVPEPEVDELKRRLEAGFNAYCESMSR